MDQVWFGALHGTLDSTNTEFLGVMQSRGVGQTTESHNYMVIPTSGTIKKLRVELDGAPGAGKSYKFTLFLDGVAASLTVTISDTDTSGNDSANTVSVSAGQTVSIEVVPTGTPTAVDDQFTMVFTGDTAKESVIMGNTSGNAILNATNEFFGVVGGTSGGTLFEANTVQLIAGSGTIKDFYVKLSIDPGTSPDAYKFTLRKNGVSQSLVVTITADNVAGNDTTNSFSVSPGDLVAIFYEPVNSPSASPTVAWGMVFEADTDGESLMIGGHPDSPSNSATEYNTFVGPVSILWTTTESDRNTIAQSCTLKDFYVDLFAAPGSGKSRTFTSRVNGADGNLVVTISDTAKTGSDTTHTDTLSDGDKTTLKAVPSGTPASARTRYGCVQVTALAAVVGNKGSLITRMEAAGFI